MFHFRRFFVFAIVFALLVSGSCMRDDNEPENGNLWVFDYSVNNLETLTTFEHNTALGGPINQPALVEASGVAVSRQNPLWTWSHNDSGHPNRIYLLDEFGQDRGTFVMNGAHSRDYEDICIGPGPQQGVNYIYLGDIGDNNAQFEYIVVYRFPEPDIQTGIAGGLTQINATLIERFEFVYPNGPRDAETLMIDPQTRDLYIVSKREAKSLIYRANYPYSSAERNTLELLAQLPFDRALGGDISDDGLHIAVKDDDRIFYWNRDPTESIIQAMSRQPRLLPYIPESQGESFGWTPGATGYVTLSEQAGPSPPNLYHYTETE